MRVLPALPANRDAARRARLQGRFASGRFRLTTYICFCGSRSEGALGRDIHACGHFVGPKPAWYKKAVGK